MKLVLKSIGNSLFSAIKFLLVLFLNIPLYTYRDYLQISANRHLDGEQGFTLLLIPVIFVVIFVFSLKKLGVLK